MNIENKTGTFIMHLLTHIPSSITFEYVVQQKSEEICEKLKTMEYYKCTRFSKYRTCEYISLFFIHLYCT